MNLITIDPGLGHTGIAFFIAGKFSYSLVIKSAGTDWIETMKLNSKNVFDVLDKHFLSAMNGVETQIWIETPRPYYTPRGMKAQRSGADIKLAVLTGAIIGICASLTNFESIHLLTAPEWKGQLPSDNKVGAYRVARYVPALKKQIDALFVKGKKKTISMDEVCAIGIGKHVLTGRL